MLNIVTGLPGACKTLYTLSKLIPQYRGRQIYTHGIPGIDHEYFGTQPLDDPELWYELPEGSVIIMDEAQSVFPLRRAGSLVPKKCAKFETHRHKGMDIVLITQDATTLDVHVRKLAGQHIHCKRLFGSNTSTIYIYGKHQPKPEDRNTIKTCISSNIWTFDKKVYDHYRSADIHTVKRKIPVRLILVPVMLIVAVVVVIFAFRAVISMFDSDKRLLQEAESTYFPGAGSESSSSFSGSRNTAESWLLARTPVVDGMPWTAPIYDEVYSIATFPKPSCVIIQKNSGESDCRCYTQQVTRLKGVSYSVCYQLASFGWFDPTLESKRGGRDRAEREPTQRSPQRRGDSPRNFGDVPLTSASSSSGKPVFTNWAPQKKSLAKGLRGGSR